MCGIAGLVRWGGLRPEERGSGVRMADTLRHRGPDDTGRYEDRHASLGHTRLSIIDVEAGLQPMSNEDGSIVVVFNGEIYNHRDLAHRLIARGHRLRTRCDTEVIAHLYEDFGDAFVEHLNGMFAIAVWDAQQHTLLLIRDRIGIKPLYWYDDGGRVLFGSELKAIMAAGNVPVDVDVHALTDYFTFGHVAAPHTIYRGMRKLEPGYLVKCTAGGASLRRYWDIPLDLPGQAPHKSEPSAGSRPWVERFADLLEDAVAIRLMSDVPIGSFLSGGVDSAIVTAAMCRRSAGHVLTHTVGFGEADHDERMNARTTATALKTDHHEVMVRSDAAGTARRLAHHFDEPFADSSAVPTFDLSQVARRRVTVALAGDGGDEMLAGYRRYRFDLAEAAVRARCPAWLRRTTLGLAGLLYPKADWLPRPLRAKTTLQNLACDDITAHLRSVAIQAGRLPAMLMRADVLGQVGDYDPFLRGRELYACHRSIDPLNRLLYVDMKTFMVDDILTKVDRASMAVGLEVRVPLLDYRIVELAAGMPARLKLSGTQDKIVLREALARWTGPEIAGRRKKGFDIPVDTWFRGPLREMAGDLLLARNALCYEWLERRSVQQVMNEHQRVGVGRRNNGHVLWTLLSLELWAQTCLKQAHRPTGEAERRELVSA